MRIAFVAEGDAETIQCWSGCAREFVSALRRCGAHVDVINAELAGWARWRVAAAAWHPRRDRWRQGFALGDAAANHKAAAAAAALGRRAEPYDAIIQAGATFEIPRGVTANAVRILYADANIRFASRGRPFSGVSRLDQAAIERIACREHRIYDAVDLIWTWSDALRDSFISDFRQAPAKVTTIFAGANVMPGDGISRPPVGRSIPMILFVGRDHVRKGSATLLEAFPAVREAIPGAELHLVGGIPSTVRAPGVINHGLIDTRLTAGRELLNSLYERATVFCLPSRYEPFGVVFVEAMLAGLPCIGTNRWAMPEIIEDGVSGWLVQDGDVRGLSSLLVRVLEDPGRAAIMGMRGRERALTLFTWDRVAERALTELGLHNCSGASTAVETNP